MREEEIPVTIGIDYRFALTTVRGIGRYVRELVAELMAMDDHNRYILYCQDDPHLTLPPNFRIGLLPKGNILWFEQVHLPRRARKDQLQVLWCPSNSGPVFLHRSIKLLVTVHDLISLKGMGRAQGNILGRLKSRVGEKYRSLALKIGLNRIDTLLTVSEYSQKEILTRFGRTAVVVYNNIRRLNLEEDEAVLGRMGIADGSYIYSMSGDAPHKNLTRLLNLASLVNFNWKLVVSGIYNEELISRMSAAAGGKVVFTGKITEGEKNSLYKHAAAFLFLPLSEGFGIPLLEAMSVHLPVIASNCSSIPEVLGYGGELTAPGDTDRILDLLLALPWDMRNYQAAQEAQLAKFSEWRAAATQMKTQFLSKP